MYTCPANHPSDTPEFCSVCGLEIPGTATPEATAQASAAVVETEPVAPPAAADGVERCPDCGAPRENDQHAFCEVCGYNFATRAAGSGPPQSYVPASAAPAPTAASLTPDPPAEVAKHAPAAAKSTDSTNASAAAARWELTLTVDANLYRSPNPDAPVGQPPQRFRLFDRETIIGRAGTEVRVQVPVHGDAGVSRRQALLIQAPDGALLLRDLGSANGTQIDGVDVLPGVDVPLADGAVIAIGAWTSIKVQAIGPAGGMPPINHQGPANQ